MNLIKIAWLMGRKTCTYSKCKTKFLGGLIHLKGKYGKDLKWWPDGGYLFHYRDTHGFPHEMMMEELEKMVTSTPTKREINEYNSTIKRELAKRGRTI